LSSFDPTDTTIEAARANVLASSQAHVESLNEDLKKIYQAAFDGWKYSVDAGRIDNTNPPKPPASYRLAKPDSNGFVWPEQGTEPVCEMPPIPENRLHPPQPPAGTIDVGADLGGGWYATGEHDRVKSGTVITLPNGLKLRKVGFCMGNGWYQQVA
jgi:hypothetical protein